MQTKIMALIGSYSNDPLKLLEAVGGYYETIKTPEGSRLTPLVGYAGKYDVGDGTKLQYVGDVYANFSKAEEHPAIMSHFASMLWGKINIQKPVVFVGPQMGGIAVAQFLALHASLNSEARYACAEKITTQLKTDILREQSKLVFARHTVSAGDQVIIAEDVLNNFSTTSELIKLVEESGAHVRAIVGLLNRSMTIDSEFIYNDKPIPVYCLVRKAFAEYRQDDPEVADDILKKNVVLKPKNDWIILTEATKKALSEGNTVKV